MLAAVQKQDSIARCQSGFKLVDSATVDRSTSTSKCV